MVALRNGMGDCSLDRPAPIAGAFGVSGDSRECGVSRQGLDDQLEEPRANAGTVGPGTHDRKHVDDRVFGGEDFIPLGSGLLHPPDVDLAETGRHYPPTARFLPDTATPLALETRSSMRTNGWTADTKTKGESRGRLSLIGS
jgi:hypothetical protein